MNMNMNVSDVIKLLADSKVELSLDNAELSVKAEKGILTPELVEQIKAHKEVLVDYLNHAGADPLKITPVSRDQNLSLSYAQQRLWLLDKMEEGSSHYNMPNAFSVKGELDLDALNLAFNEILERHECLRTCIKVDSEEKPYQKILEAHQINVNVHDLSGLEESKKDLEAKHIAQQEAASPFDLTCDIMLRVVLIKLNVSEHILLFTTHHIASDGWSVPIIVHEFCSLYGAFSAGEDNPLPGLDIQYADYAHWQREWLKGEVLEEQLDFWESQLTGLPQIHSLPLDRPRAEKQTFNGSAVGSVIDGESMQRFKALCQSHGATLFMGLYSVLNALLARHSNESDIVVGTPIANREQYEISNLIGFFANNLVLRCDLSGKPSFVTLLEQSREVLLEAYDHQQAPFEKVVERLKPVRSPAYSPLYQIMLAFQSNEGGAQDLELSDLEITHLAGESANSARYDITLDVKESDNELNLSWGYNTDLFDELTIMRMAEHFKTLIHAVLESPKLSMFSVDFLTAEETNLQLNEWNTVKEKFPANKCLHELFELQAHKHSDRTALVFDGEKMSYGELNGRANKLANYLISHTEVKPDRLIGICLDRSFDMIVSILAVLKAGCAYVPLDPQYPETRLQNMVDDAGLDIVLTSQRQIQDHQFLNNISMCLDDESLGVDIDRCSENNVDTALLRISPSNLAYVIYTSGSTGKPKGVMVEHNNVSRLLDSAQHHFEFNAEDVWCLFHSFSFDVSVWEIWGALTHGASLVILPHWLTRSTDELLRTLHNEKITVLNQTPSAFTPLIAEERQNQVELCLRYVVFAGEAINFTALRPWVEAHGDSAPELINMYGITETTVHTTFKKLNHEIIFDDTSGSLIGESLSDLSILILDAQQQLAPIGVVGEIYVGGAGVARGYFNRPELSADRFLTLEQYGGDRFYRSGDLARYLSNGELEYLGRNDSQVKLRGFRIELAEVEAHILRLKGIGQVAAICVGNTEETRRIIAYIVPSDDNVTANGISQNAVEHYANQLKTTLPEFMIPSDFVILDSLPLNPNGKLDRKKLPAPNLTLKEQEYVAPRDSLEKEIALVITEILAPVAGDNIQIGVHDNFFMLGGNSLLAVRLASKVRTLGHRASVRNIVKYPTVAGIAKTISDLSKTINTASSSDIDPVSPNTRFQATLSTEWMLRQGKLFNENMLKDIVFDVPKPMSLDDLNKTVTTVINHHDSLRTHYIEDDGKWMTIVNDKVDNFSTLFEDLTHLTDEDSIEKACSDLFSRSKKSIDIYSGPVFAAAYAKLPEGVHDRLCFSTHHIVYDGVSVDIVHSDFFKAYKAIIEGNTPKLSATASMRELAEWAVNQSQSNALFEQAKSWLQDRETSNLPVYLDSEQDRERLNTIGSTNVITKTTALSQLSIEGIDLPSLCKIALVNTLSNWSGREEVEIISISALRYEWAMLANLDLSRTVGLISGGTFQVLKRFDQTELSERVSNLQEQINDTPYRGIFFRDVQEFINDKGRSLIFEETKFNFQISTNNERADEGAGLLEFRAEDVVFQEGSQGLDKQKKDVQRTEVFSIDVVQEKGILVVGWTYSENLHRTATIESLLDNYIEEINTMLKI